MMYETEQCATTLFQRYDGLSKFCFPVDILLTEIDSTRNANF